MEIFQRRQLFATADTQISIRCIDLRFRLMQIEFGRIRRSTPDYGRSAVKAEESLQTMYQSRTPKLSEVEPVD